MVNSYSFYRLSRMGFVVTPSIKTNKNKTHYSSFAIKHGSITYHIDDMGLCEDELDTSDITFMGMTMRTMLSSGFNEGIRFVNDYITEMYGKELDIHLSDDPEVMALNFFDDNTIACTFFIGLHNKSMCEYYNRMFPHNKKGTDPESAKYNKPFIEMYSPKLKNADFFDIIGVPSKYIK